MVLCPTEHLDSAKISTNGFKFSTIVFRDPSGSEF